jgi:general secretion pathway protein G
MDRFKQRGRARRRTRGMTLVEIMVVVAIIGMIMGAVAVGAVSQLEKARVKNTRIIIHTVQEALVHYSTENTDSCPNQPLMFVCPGTHGTDGADIWSKGKNKIDDGGASGTDDIASWNM